MSTADKLVPDNSHHFKGGQFGESRFRLSTKPTQRFMLSDQRHAALTILFLWDVNFLSH